jgi:4-aminobutyrate aminotransferase-like enzyme
MELLYYQFKPICYKNELERILSCGTYGNVIRTFIPFVIAGDQLEKGLSIVEKGLDSIGAKTTG